MLTVQTPAPHRLFGYTYEWELSGEPSDATTIVQPALRCVGPDDRVLDIRAFWDGELWRARLTCDPPGPWRWSVPGADVVHAIVPDPTTRRPLLAPRMSTDRRYLVGHDGTPFFYLADTAWSVVWKGRPDQWVRYLDRRAQQGFRVVQVNLLPWDLHTADTEGNLPFTHRDVGRPNPLYFRRFDRFLTLAAERNMVVCLMLIWGGPRRSLPAASFSRVQATSFARYAVTRFAAYPVLWSLSGDGRYNEEAEKWEAVGSVVRTSDPYVHPTTMHLPPSLNWHFAFPSSSWHDFTMVQTGHRRAAAADIAALPAAYVRRVPPKAFVNGEPWYEGHPARDTAEDGPVFTAFDARFAFWVSVLSGATMGHTYGAQGIWNWKRPGDPEAELAGPQTGLVWSEALTLPGAAQCGFGAALLLTLPWWRLRPCPERVAMEPEPAKGPLRPVCAQANDACWLVYAPVGAGKLLLKGIEPDYWRARWVQPTTGVSQLIGDVAPDPAHVWTTPDPPSEDDWLLLLQPGGKRAEPDFLPTAKRRGLSR